MDINTIEWLRNDEAATVSITQRRIITQIKKLAEIRPDECQIIAENDNGSICAKVPIAWIKIIPNRNLSDAERKRRAEHARNILNSNSMCCENR